MGSFSGVRILRRGLKCGFGGMGLLRGTLGRSSCTGRIHNNVASGRHLRFLNSSILSIVITSCLFRGFGDVPRNRLAGLHTSLIYRGSLYNFSHRVNLNRFLRLNHKRRGNNNERESSVLTSTFRTILTTVCLSNNVRGTRGFILEFILPRLSRHSSRMFGSCGATLRRVVRHGPRRGIACRLVNRTKPSRTGVFRIRIRLGSGIVNGNGNGGGGRTRRVTTGRTLGLVNTRV